MKLETLRLILRPITTLDAKDVYEYARSENVGKMAGFKPHESVDETISIIDSILKVDTLAIVLKTTNKVIGTISLQEKLPKIFELGYSLSEEYWNKGITTEAVEELVDYAFKNKIADEINAGCFIENIASQKVLEKCGFMYVGIHKKDYYNYDNKYKDCKRYRLVRDEYMEVYYGN